MTRIEKAGFPLMRELCESITLENADFYSKEIKESVQRFLKGTTYYISEVSMIAGMYKPTFNCHLVLTDIGNTVKTFFLTYLCRSILTTDQRKRLTVGKELSRSKEALIIACKVYDEHFAEFDQNPKSNKEAEK